MITIFSEPMNEVIHALLIKILKPQHVNYIWFVFVVFLIAGNQLLKETPIKTPVNSTGTEKLITGVISPERR